MKKKVSAVKGKEWKKNDHTEKKKMKEKGR